MSADFKIRVHFVYSGWSVCLSGCLDLKFAYKRHSKEFMYYGEYFLFSTLNENEWIFSEL